MFDWMIFSRCLSWLTSAICALRIFCSTCYSMKSHESNEVCFFSKSLGRMLWIEICFGIILTYTLPCPYNVCNVYGIYFLNVQNIKQVTWPLGRNGEERCQHIARKSGEAASSQFQASSYIYQLNIYRWVSRSVKLFERDLCENAGSLRH